MMNEQEAMIINKVRRQERAIKSREAIIADLQKKVRDSQASLLDRRPRRYSVEFSFEPGVTQPQEKSFTVNAGTVFRCHSLETSFRVIGQAAVDDGGGGVTSGQFVNVTLPWSTVSGGGSTRSSSRQRFFDYEWQVRDTGSDREWQNVRQPSIFMLTGALSPAWLPVQATLRGSSEVFVRIDPFYSVANITNGPFNSIESFILHISFAGTEVLK